MKLRNKKTGEIRNAVDIDMYTDSVYLKVSNGELFDNETIEYHSLAELNEEWEDYEEPKDIWWLDNEGCVNHASGDVNDSFRKNRKIGNYFLSREEAEKAVEKLKAWKRLKEKGFRFDGYDVAHNSNGDLRGQLFYNAGDYCIEDVEKDLDLLFGGEE